MNVQELLQEETTYDIGKAFNAELREVAAEYEITWGEMPGFVKKGAWYGGGFAPKGGRTAEAKREMTLPFDRRLKGFFKHLVKVLSKKIADGHEVCITANTVKNGKPTPMSIEQVEAELAKVQVRNEIQASVRWYVSFSEGQAAESAFIRLDCRIVTDESSTLYMDMVMTVGDQLKDVKKKLVAISKNDVVQSKFVAELVPLWVEGGGGQLPNTHGYGKKFTIDQYAAMAAKPKFRVVQRGEIKDSHRGMMFVKGGVQSKRTKRIDSEKVIALVDKYVKMT